MAKRTKSAIPASHQRVGAPLFYELEFVRIAVTATTGTVAAVLRSQSLDASMHPDGVVSVAFGSRRPASDGAETNFVLEGFQLDSLVEYVSAQAEIRKVLETELQGEWSKWPGRKRAKGSIWQHASVGGISLYRRAVPD